MKKSLLWLLIGGIVYYAIEGLWRHFTGSAPPHVAMMTIGGLCFVAVGGINQIPRFYETPMLVQAIVGAVIVLAVEFLSGLVFNVWLGWYLWDYSHLPFNVMGQVCPLYGALWFLIMPFAIWLEDRINWYYETAHGRRARYNYTLRDAYKWLFFGESGNAQS